MPVFFMNFTLFVSNAPAEMAAVRRSPGGATLKRIANILDLFFPWETMKILRKSGQILLQTAIAFRKLFLLLSNDVCTLFISEGINIAIICTDRH